MPSARCTSACEPFDGHACGCCDNLIHFYCLSGGKNTCARRSVCQDCFAEHVHRAMADLKRKGLSDSKNRGKDKQLYGRMLARPTGHNNFVNLKLFPCPCCNAPTLPENAPPSVPEVPRRRVVATSVDITCKLTDRGKPGKRSKRKSERFRKQQEAEAELLEAKWTLEKQAKAHKERKAQQDAAKLAEEWYDEGERRHAASKARRMRKKASKRSNPVGSLPSAPPTVEPAPADGSGPSIHPPPALDVGDAWKRLDVAWDKLHAECARLDQEWSLLNEVRRQLELQQARLESDREQLDRDSKAVAYREAQVAQAEDECADDRDALAREQRRFQAEAALEAEAGLEPAVRHWLPAHVGRRSAKRSSMPPWPRRCSTARRRGGANVVPAPVIEAGDGQPVPSVA